MIHWAIEAVFGTGVLLYLLRLILRSPDGSVRHLFAVMIDDTISVVIWHQPGITISSECAIAAAQGKKWGKIACRLLGMLDPNHCALALHADNARALNAIDRLKPFV
jgi:hypothetical protein